MAKRNNQSDGAYVVTVDMGYGHQRAAFPLRDFAVGLDGIKSKDAIINANHYAGIPNADRRRWDSGRRWYERISRLKNLPLIGESIFSIMDYFQRIEPFYPKRDLSKPTIQLKTIYSMIRKGWGRDLIQRLNKNPLPLINTFFSPAYFAEEHGYKGDIYLICCDTDVSRAWAPLVPNKSRIKYLVPNRRVKERLGLYGVKQDQIFVTGFPLPKENIGGRDLKVLKSLGEKNRTFGSGWAVSQKYHETLKEFLGNNYCQQSCDVKHPLTITLLLRPGAQKIWARNGQACVIRLIRVCKINLVGWHATMCICITSVIKIWGC